MSDEIDKRVSLSLHPAFFDDIEGLNSDTAPYIAEAVSAFRDAFVTVGKIWDATENGKRNPAWTEGQRILAVGKVAEKEQLRLLGRMDRAMTTISKGIAHIEGELSRPLTERAGLGTVNSEIRAHAKTLSPDKRAKLMNDALGSGDTDTLQAILGAKPFLSGMLSEEHAHYLHRFHAKQNPALLARISVMRVALEKVERDGTKVMVEMEKAVGAKQTTLNAINAANERALAALMIEPTA